MSVLDITQINTRAEQPAGRGPALASEEPSQKFEAVSHQETQRIEQKRLERDRLNQKRLEQNHADERLQQRRRDQQRVEATRADHRRTPEKTGVEPQNTRSPERQNAEGASPEAHKHEKPEGTEKTDRTASRPDSPKKEGETVHPDSKAKGDPAQENSDSKTAGSEPDEAQTDQLAVDSSEKSINDLPSLNVTVPVSQIPASIQRPSLKAAGAGKGETPISLLQGSDANSLLPGSDANLSQFFSKLAGEGSGAEKTAGVLAGSQGSDTLSSLLLKGAAADAAKTGDFSAQLARFQGGSDHPSIQNNATSLQRGPEGRETLAPLKSYATSVDLPVQHAEWGEKVAGKLAWLTSQRMSAAEIHVTPPDLGPMHVRVQVHNDQAQVTVHAVNHVVRDQLEQNGSRLRDMLQENGLSLDSFDVSSQSQSDGREGNMNEDGDAGNRNGGGPDSGFAESSDQEASVTATGHIDLSLRGEVDTYV